MKALVFGQARSRSNFFTEAMSQGLGLNNLGEPYKDCFSYRYTTDQLMCLDNIALKIQLSDLVVDEHRADPRDFDLGAYDHIWITYRADSGHNLASRLVADQHAYSYSVSQRPAQVKPFAIDPVEHRKAIQTTALNQVGIEQIGRVLDGMNLAYTRLEYQEIPAYIVRTWGRINTGFRINNYNYDQLVTNLDQAREWIAQEVRTLTTLS